MSRVQNTDKQKEGGHARKKQGAIFDKLNKFLATRPATHPSVVLDNSTINTDTDSPATVSDEEHGLIGGHHENNEEGCSITSNKADTDNVTTTSDHDLTANTQPSADVPPTGEVQSTDKDTCNHLSLKESLWISRMLCKVQHA